MPYERECLKCDLTHSLSIDLLYLFIHILCCRFAFALRLAGSIPARSRTTPTSTREIPQLEALQEWLWMASILRGSRWLLLGWAQLRLHRMELRWLSATHSTMTPLVESNLASRMGFLTALLLVFSVRCSRGGRVYFSRSSREKSQCGISENLR